MSPEQYQLLEKVHASTVRLEERFKNSDERWINSRNSILEIAKKQVELEHVVHADRNKVLGAIFVFASGFLTMVIGFIISLFKNN